MGHAKPKHVIRLAFRDEDKSPWIRKKSFISNIYARGAQYKEPHRLAEWLLVIKHEIIAYVNALVP